MANLRAPTCVHRRRVARSAPWHGARKRQLHTRGGDGGDGGDGGCLRTHRLLRNIVTQAEGNILEHSLQRLDRVRVNGLHDSVRQR